MTRLLNPFLFGVSLLTLLTSTMLADTEKKQPPQTFMVIVGVGEFSDPQIKPRPTAVADAQALYDLFTNKDYLGLDADHIQLLISGKDEKRKAQTATRENVLKAIDQVVTRASKDDTILIAMIGQGASSGERPCFFCTDSTFKDRGKNALSAGAIEDEFKKCKARQVLALLDVNFKGFDPGKETVIEPNLLDMVRVFLGTKEKEETPLPPGKGVILSSFAGAKPIELAKQGLFTQVLIDALQGKADTEGGEPDGLVTVDELVNYLENELPKIAREVGKNREEKEQVPLVDFARLAHFPVTHNPAVYPKRVERLKKLANLAKEGKITAEVAAEGERLLSRMPKLKSQQKLRKEYQAFVDGRLAMNDFLASRLKLLDSMKIDSDDARVYAKNTLRGIEKVQAVYIKELNKGEMAANAIRGLYRRLEEKIPPEINEQLKVAKSLKDSDIEKMLVEARIALGKREDQENNKDIDISMEMMMGQLDPYTQYIDKEQVRKMESRIQGSFTGIGIQIRRDLVRDGLLVVTPIKGSPAYRSGLKAGDLVTEIRRDMDSEGRLLDKPEIISTKGMKVDKAVELILGKPGTKVKLTVQREGVPTPLEFELTRGRIEVETVLGARRKSDDSWDFMLDPVNKIGYIQLTQFARNSAEDIKNAVKELEKQGMKGLVLDLRFNPGGFLDTAVDICDLFIDDGLIVTIKPRVGLKRDFRGESAGSHLNFPMVCLINGGSASGSEIVAACLQDHGRAVIMGERSYGKGSVQNIQKFGPTEAEIKLTTATFWRPNGKNLNKSSTSGKEEEDWGVRPDKDYKIELSRQEREELADHFREREIIPRRDIVAKDKKPEPKDRQLEAALEYLRSQIKTANRTAR